MAKRLIQPYYNLALLLDAGVPIILALKQATQGFSGKIGKAFGHVLKRVEKGDSASAAMTEYPSVFGLMDRLLVDAGENSGSLPDIFKHLSNWHELIHKTRMKILSGLMLPMVVLHIAVIIFPLPKFFLGMKKASDVLSDILGVLLPVYIIFFIIFAIIKNTPQDGMPRRILDKLILRIPLLGRAMWLMSIGVFCRAFHLLFKAALPIHDCAKKAMMVIPNCVVADLFDGLPAAAKQGHPLSTGLSSKLPQDFIYSWETGEESGALDIVTGRLAENYLERGQFVMEQFATWLPRFIYMLVCIYLIMLIFSLLGGISASYNV